MVASNRKKICSKCNIEKDETDFHKHASYCKECRKEYNKIYGEQNRAKIIEQKKQYRQKNKIEISRQRKEARLRNPDKIKAKNRRYRETHRQELRDRQILRLYNLERSEVEAMLVKQKGLCAICLLPFDQKERIMCIDHDHTSGKVRGLLCSPCNHAIGHAGDSPEILRRAAMYLEIFKNSTSSEKNHNNP